MSAGQRSHRAFPECALPHSGIMGLVQQVRLPPCMGRACTRFVYGSSYSASRCTKTVECQGIHQSYFSENSPWYPITLVVCANSRRASRAAQPSPAHDVGTVCMRACDISVHHTPRIAVHPAAHLLSAFNRPALNAIHGAVWAQVWTAWFDSCSESLR